MKILSYFHGIDPAAALVVDGTVAAYVEEERLLRNKHAANLFPIKSIEACLALAGVSLADVDLCVYGWDAPRYGSGDMARFYQELNRKHPPDEATARWQQRNVGLFAPPALTRTLTSQLVKAFGVAPDKVPPLAFYPHHKTHAAAAFFLSPADEALVLTLDGSGDSDCTTVWRGKGTELEALHRIEIPNSVGWFYAAITELLGFDAYDGEYKVMGLAAYGRENLEIRAKLAEVVKPGPLGFDYVVDPTFIHHGPHTYSERFTDRLVTLLGIPPRQGPVKLTSLHEDIAFEAQHLLEETVLRLVGHFAKETKLRTLCIGGGVGLNVKLNSRLHKQDLFDRVYAFPIPNDSGLAIGAAIGTWVERTGKRPPPLDHVYLGPGYADDDIENQLRQCGLAYRKPDDLADATAELLAGGKVVGWFQGRMEGGPRALGGRSILADPRNIAARDRVNAAIKFREYWRPFCPSLTVESSDRFLRKAAPAPFMILAFDATDEATRTVPAVVHVDGTMRVQTVDRETNPRYHALLEAFGARTGVPVLLNTSFNVKGEAIVCTPRDALRTFFATGIDALAIGAFLVEKPREPLAVRPDDVLR
ncbi:MAG TPA: carbamoyltransferase C-terminal domain-containing protein [Kofleriaceae bacterium]